ncbi:MAG TPA: hypothetical protein VKR61_26140 [Bryobacteraceae bacterium]|nr:hypothetical protein [Bryobacteraceae bacterium]
MISALGGESHPYLSAATRKASESGHPLFLKNENWQRYEAEQRSIRVSEKWDHLLRLIAEHTETPGCFWKIRPTIDYPLIAAVNATEVQYYLDYLAKTRLMEQQENGVRLTVFGWERVQPPPTAAGIPGRCFVAMAFRPTLDIAFRDGIKAAVESDCGFTAIRMLDLEHNDKICDRIIVELRKAQFVVADFTFQRGGVYFEAGFAAALGRPVIWTCKACHFHRLHFDTRQYNHIKWDGVEDLRSQLAARIRGTIPGARLDAPVNVS